MARRTPAPQGDRLTVKDQADSTEPETDAADDEPRRRQGRRRRSARNGKSFSSSAPNSARRSRRCGPPPKSAASWRGSPRQNDLSGDDIAGTLRMAAMLRAGDYASFYKAVAPFVRTAQEYLGIVLPKDLAAARSRRSDDRGGGEGVCPAAFRRTALASTSCRPRREAASRQRVQATQGDVQRAVSSFETQVVRERPRLQGESTLRSAGGAGAAVRTRRQDLDRRGGPGRSPRKPTTRSTSQLRSIAADAARHPTTAERSHADDFCSRGAEISHGSSTPGT